MWEWAVINLGTGVDHVVLTGDATNSVILV